MFVLILLAIKLAKKLLKSEISLLQTKVLEVKSVQEPVLVLSEQSDF